MTGEWSNTDLSAIAAANEIEVAPARPDDRLCRSTTIWVVGVDDGLYVRSYRAHRAVGSVPLGARTGAGSEPGTLSAMSPSKKPQG